MTGMNMLRPERHSRILAEIELKGSLDAAVFAQRIGISGMTIRRDLATLASQGLVERVHGGAIRPRHGGPASARRLTPLMTLGMVVPSANYYFPEIIRGAKTAAAEVGARLVLGVSGYSETVERQQIARLSANEVDGIVMTPSGSMLTDPRPYAMLQDLAVPAVVVERDIDEAHLYATVATVRSDHSHGAELAVRHLHEQGYRHIALACRESATAPPVRTGFLRARAALPVGTEALQFDLPTSDTPIPTAREHIDRLLDDCLASGVDAIIVLPDEVAISLVEAAQDRGLRIPEDLAVVAYDDEVASLAAVPLTAVAPPKFQVGYLAVRSLADRVIGSARGTADVVSHVDLPPVVIERESTARDLG
jgi:DNA-binding LacI/PurR family transcriptional regulator